jgi:hypothetical protein
MDVMEKLVELLRNSPHLDVIKGYKGNDCTFEQGADWLIANGVTVQEWISVKDRLPDEYEPVLVYDPDVGHGQCVMYACWSVDGWKTEFDFDHHEDHGITHWMPLPTPPKEEK